MKNAEVFKWRVVEPWHEPDGVSFFSHHGNIFTWADMLETQDTSPLGRYVKQVRNWGFNGMAFYLDTGKNPEAVCNFASYLKKNGIGMIIRREWCETEYGSSWPIIPTGENPKINSSPMLSPYNEEVHNYWMERIARDYEMIPDLAGYRMNGTEFYFAHGAPWMGVGPTDNTKTGRERARDAIRLVADLLKPYGGTLFWETCQDDPWGQRQERHYFNDLTGEIPENAHVVLKRYYWDFQPSWPKHPLIEVITRDANGNSPYMTSIQSPGEYRGVHDFPWCMVDGWSDCFHDMVSTGQSGVWVMAIVKPDEWDHPLNMVNWYGIASYLRDPQADPMEIKLAWAREQFGSEVALVVVEILKKVTEAARGMYEFDGLWTANHSLFPNLEYLDSHLCGPYRQMKRMTGMMGWVLPLDMYKVETQARIRIDPKTRLAYNQVPVTFKLKAEIMAQKEGAVKRMEEAVAMWRTLEGKIDAARYEQILDGLEGNLNDTIVFRCALDLYMDWKLGVLTETKIDAVLASCQGLRGKIIPDPLDKNPKRISLTVEPASLATLAEQLRRDLREPWVEKYWLEHALGASVGVPIDWSFEKEKNE